jgi:1-deoxy-D-xylulose-5-phosphate reductoisomerase
MAAIVGPAGLAPCLAAARAGKRLLLANKEALVVGGEVFMRAVREGGATLLPIDSEHSAIFQSLPEDPATWAAGGQASSSPPRAGRFAPARPATLRDVTPEQACAHPNWVMGRKISVDSATMMNKALEVIEARYLFGMAPEQLEVVIHPQSVIHSMVQYRDTSMVAQLGTPDMRVPIAYGSGLARAHRSRARSRWTFQPLAAMTLRRLTRHGHRSAFPACSWRGRPGTPPGTTAVLNAANEVAVAAFLDGASGLTRFTVNLATLDAVQPPSPIRWSPCWRWTPRCARLRNGAPRLWRLTAV